MADNHDVDALVSIQAATAIGYADPYTDRRFALDLALKARGGCLSSADRLVADARVFEAYLGGPPAAPGADASN